MGAAIATHRKWGRHLRKGGAISGSTATPSPSPSPSPPLARTPIQGTENDGKNTCRHSDKGVSVGARPHRRLKWQHYPSARAARLDRPGATSGRIPKVTPRSGSRTATDFGGGGGGNQFTIR